MKHELTLSLGGLAQNEDAEPALRELGYDLQSLPEISVRHTHLGAAQEGAKALDGNIVGLIVGLSGAGAILPTALTVLRDWLVRQRPTTKLRIKLGDTEVEWDGATPPAEILALVASLKPGA